jgi:hypothetical protein
MDDSFARFRGTLERPDRSEIDLTEIRRGSRQCDLASHLFRPQALVNNVWNHWYNPLRKKIQNDSNKKVYDEREEPNRDGLRPLLTINLYYGSDLINGSNDSPAFWDSCNN